jgi:ATP-dependent DNA helicase RecG
MALNIGLKKALQSGESETVEFKQSLAEKDQILETISAFSNSRGGAIYVGVDEARKVSGVQIGKKTLESLANDIKMATDPKIFPSIEIISKDKRDIILVHVYECPIKPVWVNEKVFERVGKTNQRVPAERVRQLVRESHPFQWDKHVLHNASLSDIDSKRVKDFLRRFEDERNTEFEGSRSVQGVLAKLHLEEKGKPTAAAMLLFGKDPQAWCVQSEVRCGRFNGTEAVNFEDMTVLRGTLIQQVPEVLAFLNRNVRISARFTGQPEREETWEYPKEALREAIVNAICHRDYQDTGNVQVRIFDDRIEIWNPGMLPAGLTVEDLKSDHRSQPQNSLIAECFYSVKYVEQWGTGTNRMIRLCKDAGLPEPKFEQKAGSFVVTFKKGNRRIVTTAPKSIWKLNNTQKKIIEYLKRHGKAKTSEIQKHMGISLRAIRRNLKEIAVILNWSGKSPTDPTGKYSLKSLKNFKSLFK